MTCIVGLVNKGSVWMGGDSACTSGWDLTLKIQPKVFRNGEFLIGLAGSPRMAELLEHAFTPPAIEGGLYKYMVTKFVDEVRACLKTGGYAYKENEHENTEDIFLVGIRGRLFSIWQDYHVGEYQGQGYSVGCGSAYALGSLFATERKPAAERITKALEAAEFYSAGVRGPFTVLHLEATK